jgi:hypothetical protein
VKANGDLGLFWEIAYRTMNNSEILRKYAIIIAQKKRGHGFRTTLCTIF